MSRWLIKQNDSRLRFLTPTFCSLCSLQTLAAIFGKPNEENSNIESVGDFLRAVVEKKGTSTRPWTLWEGFGNDDMLRFAKILLDIDGIGPLLWHNWISKDGNFEGEIERGI